MHEVDRISLTNRWRHRHPAEKLALALGLLGVAVALPPWPAALLVAVVSSVALLAGARIPVSVVLRLLRVPAGFVVLSLLAVAVTVTWAGGPRVQITEAGLRDAVSLAARALAALLALQVAALTTPLVDVLPRLQRLGVPTAVTEVMALIHRLVFLTFDTAGRIRTAQELRLGWSTIRRSGRSFALLAATLFTSTMHRGRRLEIGMAARGYTGRLATLDDVPAPSAPALLAALGTVAAVLAVSLLVDARW